MEHDKEAKTQLMHQKHTAQMLKMQPAKSELDAMLEDEFVAHPAKQRRVNDSLEETRKISKQAKTLKKKAKDLLSGITTYGVA